MRLNALGDAWNRGDVTEIMSYFTDDCVEQASVGPEPGKTYHRSDAVRRGVPNCPRLTALQSHAVATCSLPATKVWPNDHMSTRMTTARRPRRAVGSHRPPAHPTTKPPEHVGTLRPPFSRRSERSHRLGNERPVAGNMRTSRYPITLKVLPQPGAPKRCKTRHEVSERFAQRTARRLPAAVSGVTSRWRLASSS